MKQLIQLENDNNVSVGFQIKKSFKAAFFYTFPFQLRVLKRIAEEFEQILISDDIEEIKKWKPNLLFTADVHQIPNIREFCNLNEIKIIGLRHGVANKYIPTNPEFGLANYVCGSEWDKNDFESCNIIPKDKFLITGNPWIDDVFKIPHRELNKKNPTILFAPTYNPEVSAAFFLKDDLVSLIKKIYPESKIIIKPHPAIIDNESPYVAIYKEIFIDLVKTWKRATKKYSDVHFVEDSEVSISDYFSETDILISDGSSLIFEFMILDRPILLYNSGEKVKFWSHFYDQNAISNGKREVGSEFQTKDEFLSVLKNAFNLHSEIHSQFQQRYSEEMFGSFTDGNSSKRAAEAVKNAFLEEKDVVKDIHSFDKNASCEDQVNNHDTIMEDLIHKGKFLEAKFLILDLMVFNPGDVYALNNLSVIKIIEQKFKDAASIIEKVLVIEPDNEIALNNLAHLEGKIDFELSNKVDSARALENVECLIEKGDLENAKNSLKNILLDNPQNIDALNDLVVILIMEGNFEKASEAILEILKIDPNNEIAIENLSYLEKVIENAISENEKE